MQRHRDRYPRQIEVSIPPLDSVRDINVTHLLTVGSTVGELRPFVAETLLAIVNCLVKTPPCEQV